MHYNAIQHGTEYRVQLHGSFTFDDHVTFNKIIAFLDEQQVTACLLDFSGVDFVDSAALGMLLLIREKSQQKKFKLALKHPYGQVKKMFDISEFSSLFDIDESH